VTAPHEIVFAALADLPMHERTSLARAIGDLAIRAYEQGRADERREQRARRIDAAMASQALRKVPATLHQHRPTVIDVDAYEALLADDAAAE